MNRSGGGPATPNQEEQMTRQIIQANTAAELAAALEIPGVAIECPARLADAFGFALVEDVGTDEDLDAAMTADGRGPEGRL